MPVKAPTLKSLVEKAAAAVKKEATAEPAQAGEVEDAPAEDAPEEALTLCVRGFGAEPVDAADLPSWRHQRELHAQLCSLYRKRYPLELEIDFVTKFEGYGQELPFYILGVAGEQDAPHFSGEKKLGMWDNDDGSSGVDFCAPIGTFSAPEGGAEKITTAIDALRAGGMLPAEPTAAEMAEMNAKGLIIMPNIPTSPRWGGMSSGTPTSAEHAERRQRAHPRNARCAADAEAPVESVRRVAPSRVRSVDRGGALRQHARDRSEQRGE